LTDFNNFYTVITGNKCELGRHLFTYLLSLFSGDAIKTSLLADNSYEVKY